MAGSGTGDTMANGETTTNRGWAWLAGVAGGFAGRHVGEVTAVIGARMAGVSEEGVTPYMAALAKGHQNGPTAGAIVGAFIGLIVAYTVGAPRGWGLVVSPLIGLVAGAISGGMMGFLAGYY